MPVVTPIPIAPANTAPAGAAPAAAGPICSLQRSGSLFQLGIEAQELTTAIGQLAEQLQSDDDNSRSQVLAELEAALLAEEGNKTALAAKADATCWVIEHLRGQARLSPAAGQAAHGSRPLRCGSGRCPGGIPRPGPHSPQAAGHPVQLPEPRAHLPQIPGRTPHRP